MKRQNLILPILFLIFIAIVQCRHEPEFPPVSGNPCNPDTVYFERDLLPVLRSSCAKSGCHDAGSAVDGVILDSYAQVMATADVRPGNPEGSDLYEVLVEDDPDKRMPPSALPPLTNDQIAMVRKWILQGAQNLFCDED